ncbi:putative acyltransferase [Corynebacterium kutscheri]|uniref:Integral membrane acyltransferase n=1 Tax=Corynebacterium kutscheri TaxID=35755 RepID=A0A0F6R384_9CORY|nr:acyltransferase [Corynebacterium kutscheri]AKE42108.1 putative acyltransferase [Corynebacterium kutscheri]VEH05965.1 putative integral membrane acyltransferase [Corynebacterium kutscheri]VEH10451.1 putative integral membrane acyltransferase [Corynebacterium kutscheri]
MSQSYPQFKPQLEGLRAVAAFGVLLTHTAFQTGVNPGTIFGAVLARFDYFVAVFFALSAFLLWRNFHRQGYYLRRAARIIPACWVCVLLVVAFLPEAFDINLGTIFATLSFTQIYFPNSLAGGLTHLWSLAVEVAFYLVLPLLFRLLSPYRRTTRISLFLILACLSFIWSGTPWPESGVNFQIFPPSYIPWFVVGLVLAELETVVYLPAILRWLSWPLAVFVAWIAGQEWFGPLGLVHPNPGEFVLRIMAGTLFCALVITPYALADTSKSVLSTPVALWLGKISYSIFLWHVPLLSLVFPLLGINIFSGNFFLVTSMTSALSVAVAFISYELVEEPARIWAKKQYVNEDQSAL